MNNLTTRKIVLGLLMALVLAFSVQGIADALTLRINSGDLTTVSLNQGFTLRFSVLNLKSPLAVNSTSPVGQVQLILSMRTVLVPVLGILILLLVILLLLRIRVGHRATLTITR